ncbi:MAG: CmcJ/NvfI family oxidoreductase [bacterium]
MTLEHNRLLKVPVQYLANDENLAIYVASVGGGEIPQHEGNYEMRTVIMTDGRNHDSLFNLDRHGFKLVKHCSLVSDFDDGDQVTSVYETEIKDLVKAETGAIEVIVFDHTRRAASEQVRKQKMVREPASTIHNDYTAWSGPNRLREIFRERRLELEELADHRFAIVNIWRSAAGTIENYPLAMCDASSTVPVDLVSVKRQANDRIGEIQLATYNPKHRWFYFPHMAMDEALLFKTYDSAEDGRARFTIHTSFDDPTAPSDAPVRQSIETRCFAFFQERKVDA